MLVGQHARTRSDSPFPAKCTGAGAGPDAPLRQRPAIRRVDGGDHVRFRHVLAPDVVQVAVVRLAHHGVHGVHVLVPRLVEGPPHHGLHRRTHVERVREHDGRLDGAQFPHLKKARRLAKSIADVHGCRHVLCEQVAPVRKNRRDPRAHGVTLDQGAVAYSHAVDVGERVQGARLKNPRRDAEVANAGRVGLGRAHDGRKKQTGSAGEGNTAEHRRKAARREGDNSPRRKSYPPVILL